MWVYNGWMGGLTSVGVQWMDEWTDQCGCTMDG